MELHTIVGASCLSALRPGHDHRPTLDELAALGVNLVRVFCGALSWAEQTPGDVYMRLPTFLDDCHARGLDAYLSYITDAGTGYDLERHVDELEAMTAGRVNVLREVANEPYHPTQGGRLPWERLSALRDRMAEPAALGAAEDDESDDNTRGDFGSVHRDRSRDKWNCVRRVREIEGLSDRAEKAAIDQEPIGAAEVSEPGRRESDPAIFFTQSVLAKIMAVGTVLHSTDGLAAVPFRVNQRMCAQAFIRGSQCWQGTRLTFKNAGWHDSPVKDAAFSDRPGGTVVRVYSGVSGDSGITCALGLTGEPKIEWQNGWAPRETDPIVDELPGVIVYAISRG
jgi:hypothetical protein